MTQGIEPERPAQESGSQHGGGSEETEAEDRGTAFPAPFAPDKDDDTPLGDTDQHSDA